MRLDGIPDALRDFGLEPVLVAGWEKRGREFDKRPTITIRHWTAGGTKGKAPSLGICTNGRHDLPGPLCQVLQERSGGPGLDRVYVVAAGRANHSGAGQWEGVTSGNSNGTGNEIEWSGFGETFPDYRKETSERVAAALLSISAKPDGKYACEHREYALPAGRKVDTNLNGPELRLRVQQLLHDPGDDDMALSAEDKQWIRECFWNAAGPWANNVHAGGKQRSEVWRWQRETVIAIRDLTSRVDALEGDDTPGM